MIAPIALTAIACCAVGIGAYYFLSPEHGEERRAMALEKSSDVVKQTGDLFRRVGQQLRSRLIGMTSAGESFSDPAKVGLAGTSGGTADQYPQMQQ